MHVFLLFLDRHLDSLVFSGTKLEGGAVAALGSALHDGVFHADNLIFWNNGVVRHMHTSHSLPPDLLVLSHQSACVLSHQSPIYIYIYIYILQISNLAYVTPATTPVSIPHCHAHTRSLAMLQSYQRKPVPHARTSTAVCIQLVDRSSETCQAVCQVGGVCLLHFITLASDKLKG